MNLHTKETHAAYKTGISTIDMPPLIQNQIQKENDHRVLLIDLSKAFESVGRPIRWGILFDKGIPWGFIQQIRAGHIGNKPWAKYNGVLGPLQTNNKRVFQGGPIRAMLFIIYCDHILQTYEDNLRKQPP